MALAEWQNLSVIGERGKNIIYAKTTQDRFELCSSAFLEKSHRAPMSGLGHERSFGTAVLRVRSLGYTGRELDVTGTSLLSQSQTFNFGTNQVGR